jgi:hypothetical protein
MLPVPAAPLDLEGSRGNIGVYSRLLPHSLFSISSSGASAEQVLRMMSPWPPQRYPEYRWQTRYNWSR